MRLSSLLVAVVLLFSSAVFAQHSSTSGAPSSPTPSPAPAAAPSSPPPAHAASPSPTPSSSPTSSASPSASAFHNSAPSSPGTASTPATHSAATTNTSPSHASGSSSSDWSTGKTASPTHSSDSAPGRVIPREKLSGNEGRIASSPRIGDSALAKEKERDLAKEKDRKVPEPDLRRRICANGACKEPESNPAEADLRRRICKDGSCPCPAGQAAGKNGNCVPTSAPASTASACQPNESWNGNACAATNRCHAGELWNGFECLSPGQCTMFSSRGSLLAMDARSAHRDKEAACNNDPYGQECMRLTQSYDSALLSYEMLLNEAPVSCRTMLPDPPSL